MKQIISTLLSISAIFFVTSCGESPSDNAATIVDINTTETRAGEVGDQVAEATQAFEINGKSFTVNVADIMTAVANENANQASEDAMNIVNSLMGADKEAQVLEVTFLMSDKPVDNGIFVFGIETENPKSLTMQMFDEEGFGMVANNEFDITGGNNFKALNVTALNSGNYIFRLKDADGKELQKTVTVSNE
jgi:hypothetical protein